MNYRTRNILYTLILLVSVFAVWWYRKNYTNTPVKVEGNTMGTTYHITYFDKHQRNFKTSIDSLLFLVNKSINTYDSTSEVTRFNKSSNGVAVSLPYLLPPLSKAAEIFRRSSGAFDPTVMPLVNAWGFGPGRVFNMDSTRVDSLKVLVGFEKVKIQPDSIVKLDPRTQLDFGGIGQGYGADVITDFLKSKGITNMLVELGGEGMACGINLQTNSPWSIGILDPNSTREKQFFKAYVSLQDKSFTTSGNYFNYKIVDGKKFSHTIDPESGFPVQRAILSASVFASDATTADAWATAFMVMGHEKAMEILQQQSELNAFLVYTSSEGEIKTFVTEGLKPFIEVK